MSTCLNFGNFLKNLASGNLTHVKKKKNFTCLNFGNFLKNLASGNLTHVKKKKISHVLAA